MSGQATVNIPTDVLEPIVKAQVTAGTLKAFGDPAKLIEAVVGRAINQKVDSDGKVNEYSSCNKYDFIEILAQKAIHKIAHEMLAEFVQQQRPKIEKAVKDALAKKTGAFSKALVDGMAQAVTSSWSFKCDVNFPRD